MVLYQSWMNPKLKVLSAKSHGKGIFANEPVKKGERVAIFGGDIMRIDEIDSLPEEIREYAVQIEERFVIGLRTVGKVEDTDYFNHSCNPNVGFKGQIFLVAMRDIKKGEEITFDYAMTISESVGSDIVFDLDCNCGEKSCRKKITEDDWKLPELRNKYKGFFSQYIQDKIDSESVKK